MRAAGNGESVKRRFDPCLDCLSEHWSQIVAGYTIKVSVDGNVCSN
jgi:hypothetical protein